MRCEAARERMSRFLDDELSSSDRASLQEHLAGCLACGAEYAAQQRLWALISRVEPVQSPNVFASVEARLSAPRGLVALVAGLRFRTLVQAAAAAALVAAFIGAGVWAGNTRHRSMLDEHDRAVSDLLTDTPPGMEVVTLLDEIGARR